MTHTPGPWEHQRIGRQHAHEVWSPENANVASVAYRPMGKEGEELANARLIASAPELLAVAELFAQYMRDNGGDKEFHGCNGKGWLTAAESAIAKAKGTE